MNLIGSGDANMFRGIFLKKCMGESFSLVLLAGTTEHTEYHH